MSEPSISWAEALNLVRSILHGLLGDDARTEREVLVRLYGSGVEVRTKAGRIRRYGHVSGRLVGDATLDEIIERGRQAPDAVRFLATHLDQLISEAKNGDKFAIEALRRLGRELDRQDGDIPQQLRELFVLWKVKSPKAAPARHYAVNLERNYLIATAVLELTEAGFKAKRNRVNKPNSACDVIAEVMPHITYDAIKNVWDDYRAGRPEKAGRVGED